MSLGEALAAARAELEQLKAREVNALTTSGLPQLLRELTEENQRLSEQREAARQRIDSLKREVKRTVEHRAMLELQLKGARSRTQKLRNAL